jgi:hypothetical protein
VVVGLGWLLRIARYLREVLGAIQNSVTANDARHHGDNATPSLTIAWSNNNVALSGRDG